MFENKNILTSVGEALASQRVGNVVSRLFVHGVVDCGTRSNAVGLIRL
jgi:hypothetical protein